MTAIWKYLPSILLGFVIAILLNVVYIKERLTISEPVSHVATIAVPETLNDNPELDLGVCGERIFWTSQWGQEYIKQCVPVGYSLHEDIVGSPIRVHYTGAAYSIRPLGTKGQIGFTLPAMTLSPGEYLVQVGGFAHFWGVPGEYAIRGHYQIEGVPGIVQMGGMPLEANGNYLATFTLLAPQTGVYNVSVYLLMVHASQTADSFITIEAIEVIEK